MTKEAELHAAEDRKLKELIEERNRADTMVYSIERNLKDLGSKIDAETHSEIETKLRAVKEASKGTDLAHLRKTLEELQTVSHRMSEALYKQTSGATGEQPTKEDKGGKEGTDYRVVDDQDK